VIPEKRGFQTEGLFLIIERSNLRGLKRWGDELERRQIPAVLQIDGSMD